jgi:serine/threonine-protein kinase RsbW
MYESLAEKNKITAVFSAALANVDILCSEIKRMLEASRLSGYLFSIQLIIREAVNNAIIHGSGNNPEMKIKVAFHIKNNAICISVLDQGAGFDWRSQLKKVADPLVPSGRGMEIMRTYATEAVFNNKGNRVTLKVIKSKET